MSVSPEQVAAGHAVYTKRMLGIYDFLMLGLSNRLIWRCPTQRLVEHYNRHVTANHLDVWVGTGYFLDRCRFPSNPPRVALMDRLTHALAAFERTPGQLAVLFVDLDHFKTVNDKLGHDTGDHVLTTVAQRLVRVARRTDTVARFGGDEFVLLLSGLRSADDLRVLCDRFLDTLREPLEIAQGTKITGSLGAVVSCDADANPAELVQHADLAMYHAKRTGRDRVEIYSPAMHALSAKNAGSS